MTCREKITKTRGYTFLELALVLAIIAIVFFSVVPVIFVHQRERQLKTAMDSIAQLARDCRFTTEDKGVEAVLAFQTNGVMPLSKGTSLTPAEIGNCSLLVKYPGGQWERANGQDWRFFSGGMVEPVSVRLENGDAWVESDFDFLTGSVADERYSF